MNSNFAKEQVNEEKAKAKIIIETPANKTLIHNLEDTEFCKGTITWCLNCVENNDFTTILPKIKEIIDTHLNSDKISNLLQRALFTIGDNCFYDYYYYRYKYKEKKHSWSENTKTNRKCLITSRQDLKKYFTKGNEFEKYFKELITKLLETDLQNIIDEYVKDIDQKNIPNWEKLLIKEPKFLDSGEYHYFGVTGGDNNTQECYLYKNKKVQPSSREECMPVLDNLF